MDFKLGLGPTPDPIYLYVGETESDAACWYTLDPQNNQVPVKEPALTGYLAALRVTEKEFKGKPNYKLDILMKADRNYVIRSGVETSFSRGVLLALEAIVQGAGDIHDPLVIAVQRGDEDKVVFGRVYLAATGERIKAEWDRDCKLLPIIEGVQAALGEVSSGGHTEAGPSQSTNAPAAERQYTTEEARQRNQFEAEAKKICDAVGANAEKRAEVKATIDGLELEAIPAYIARLRVRQEKYECQVQFAKVLTLAKDLHGWDELETLRFIGVPTIDKASLDLLTAKLEELEADKKKVGASAK